MSSDNHNRRPDHDDRCANDYDDAIAGNDDYGRASDINDNDVRA
jgi:hypothetical protein